MFGWPDPTHPIVGVPDQDYVQEFTPGCKEVLRTPALQGESSNISRTSIGEFGDFTEQPCELTKILVGLGGFPV